MGVRDVCTGRGLWLALPLLAGACSFDASTARGIDRDGSTSIGPSEDGDGGLAANDDAAVDRQAACLSDPDYVERPGSDHRYFRETTTLSVDLAQTACAAVGAHLVVIGDSEENDFVMTLGGEPWIGYFDLEVEGSFNWGTGEPTAYDDFSGNEPNDNGGREDCVRIRSGNWNDDRCGGTRESVCECDPALVIRPAPLCMTSGNYSDVYEGRQYRYEPNSQNYAAAEAECASEGGHLAVISDDAENEFLTSLIGSDSWIGFLDEDMDGTHAWTTGSANPYTAWGNNQPDNPGGENCVELRTAGDWNDQSCSSGRDFVCECDPLYAATTLGGT